MAQTPATEVLYEGDGIATKFGFSFPYLKANEVFVDVDGVNVPYTFLAGSTSIVELTVAPALGAIVRVWRNTLAFAPTHTFAGGVPFLPRYVDENNRQLLYATQEAINDTAGTASDALVVAEEARVIAQSAEAKVDDAIQDSAIQLRQDLADATDPAKGAGLSGFDPTLDYAAGTVGGGLRQLSREFVRPQDYDPLAGNNDGRDDTAAILSAVAALSNPSRNVLYFPYGTYRTSQNINIPAGANTVCAPGVVFQRHGSAPKTFAAITVNGGGREHYLGLFDAYADGIVVRGSTNRVRFQRISNCTRGLVISAISASNLDNKIDGVQIGRSTDAIVFEQSGKRVQQGNEIRVNFVNESLNTLVFDDLGTHTEQSHWDSNLVELMASDPFYKVGATLCLNKSGFSVPALNYAIKSWAGGWNVGDGTITVIKGPFSTCIFDFSFAAPISAGDLVASGPSRAASDSCQFVLPRTANLGSGAAIDAVAIGTAFNGGVDLVHKRFRLACTYPALAAGQTTRVAFRHILAQTNYGGRFKIVGVETGGVPLIFNIRNSGTESHGWASVWAYNPAATTVAGATYNIIIEAGD